jgi:hypothetical protein
VLVESFEDVLRARRRQHTITFRPGGTPWPLYRPVAWLDVGYFAALFVLSLMINRLLHVDALIEHVVHPGAAALIFKVMLPWTLIWTLGNAQLDGRKPHRWAWSYVRFFTRPKRTLGGRTMRALPLVYAGRVRLFWDITAPRLHHGWVRGGSVSTTGGVRFTHALRHRHSVIRPSERHPAITGYPVPERVEIRP